MKKIVVGITGASGSIYAKRLIEELLEKEVYVHLICTDNGRRVMEYELALDIEGWCQQLQEKYIHFQLEDNGDLFAAVASGSYRYDGVVILPCSMGTLAEISNGLAKSLLCRAADVALKESRQLILVPRETPLNGIHLENMLKLSRAGAVILPAMPGFYHKPLGIEDLVNFVVGKTLDCLSIEHRLFQKWGDSE